MKTIISFLFPHRHRYEKPIASRYVSFYTRDIVYQCKCGKRIIYKTYNYDCNFPIPTNLFMTYEQLQGLVTTTGENL